jgi:gluconokinase
MNPFVLGIDIGTGSTKAVAVGLTGEPLFVSQSYYPTYCSQPGYSEQDPELIWQAFINCVDEVISSLHKPIAISFSSAMHSLIAMDKEGNPLANMMTWADARSEKIVSEIKETSMADSLYYKTGTPLHPMSPIFKIMWIKQNQPEIFAKTDKFISIKEFIWYRLFKQYQVDYSIASSTGLFNTETLKWNSESLDLAGISEGHLSEIVSTSYSRKGLCLNASSLLSITPETSFIIGASDGCLANVGSYASEPGIAALTIGTSGAVRVAGKLPIRNSKAMLFNYRLDDEMYISGGAINNGGNTLEWFMKSLLSIEKPDYASFFKDISEINPGSDGLIFLPYVFGERAPIWDIKSSGSFIGIKSYHTRNHFERAVLEGVCFALNDVLRVVEEASGPIKQLNVSGGIVLSKAWQQILADVTGKDICIVQIEDASAVGAAIMGMKSLGLIESYSSLAKSRKQSVVNPTDNHKVYQKTFKIYRQLYTNLKESMHQLYNLNHN